MVNEWQMMSLEDAVQINPHRNLHKATDAPCVAMEDLAPFQRKIEAIRTKEYKGSGSRFRNGDTLLARITPCLENGKTAFISELPVGTIAYGSTEFIVLSGREGLSDNLFVYYLARDPNFRMFTIQLMEGTSGRQRVPASALARLNVELPPLPEQRAIAAILGALDDKIELNRRMNQTLQAMAQALFKSWFVDFEPFRDEGMEESPLGPIPKGWANKPLDEIADFTNGLALQNYPPEGNDYLPVIKIVELRRGVTESSGKANPNIDNAYIVEDGDILFSWSGSLEVCIWCGGRGALNQHLFKVTSQNYPKWFYYCWTKHYLPQFQAIAAGKATTMGHIQRYHLSAALVAIPPEDKLKLMDREIMPIFKRIIHNNLESRTLAATRDTLLPKLLSGEVRVKDAAKFLEVQL